MKINPWQNIIPSHENASEILLSAYSEGNIVIHLREVRCTCVFYKSKKKL